MDAELPTITPSSSLPLGFEKYEFIEIKLRPNKLRKRKGSFKALFKIGEKEKSIYFKYDIDAMIDVFKAKHKLYNDKIISSNDYERVSIKIDKLPSKIIACSVPEKLMTKNYVREGKFLTMNKFVYKKDILRGTHVQAYIKDGMLTLELEATVLKDADVGETVKIKADNGKIFRAKLISPYKAIIME